MKQLAKDLVERAPMVWLLLGLLFVSLGLYVGFDKAMSFVYLVIGAFCVVYGVTLFFFLFREGPKKSARPLSKNFISAGRTVVMPAPDTAESS